MGKNPDAFAKFEHDGWQRVAGKYENAWSSLTRSFIPHLLDALKVASRDRLLDVACGPGYVAESARSRGAVPIGVDFSSEMIRLAQERSPGIEFREGNAQSLDFDERSFDAVAMNFGVLHLSNPQAAFAEARRVLRDGGRYGFTVWAGPDASPGARIVEEAVRLHARMGDLPQGPDYFGFCDEGYCRQELRHAGFDPDSVLFHTVMTDWLIPNPSFLFECERDAGVRTAALLAAQTPEALSEIQHAIERSVRGFARRDEFAIPFGAHIVTAKVERERLTNG